MSGQQVLHYEGYGKDFIKRFRTSPDAWAQLVKQLAFHKMFGRTGVTYESAQTRKYQLGRTEVIRSASTESKRWAEAMLNPTESVGVLVLVKTSTVVFMFGEVGRAPGKSVPCGSHATHAILCMGCGRTRGRPSLFWSKEDAPREGRAAGDLQG
jgi:hypothetical protein